MEIEELSIGDSIPGDIWHLPTQVVTPPYGQETITLDDYKDKLIILDFWATWCSTCIGNFPKLNTLQNENEETVQVLLVNSKSTRDTREKAEQFLAKRQKDYTLTSIVEDTVLTQLFPHLTIPHYVWINKGRFLAVTDGEDLTNENVRNALNGKDIQTSYMPEIEYNAHQPLFENGNGGEAPEYIYKTILAPFVNGLKSSLYTERNKERLISRITFTNINLSTIYSYAYPEMQNLSKARLIMAVENSEPFETDNTSLSWKRKNLYTYEAQFPPTSELKAKQIVQQDLQKYFGYKVISEIRELDCWVVKAVDNPAATNFQGDLQSETNLYDQDGSYIFFNNYSLSDLLIELERLYKEPFIDETGIKEPVKLNLPSNLLDSAELQRDLEKQGLLLFKEKRMIPVVILSDRG